MRRTLGAAALALIWVSSPGCGMTTPRNFRKIQHPAPMVRARALSLGDRRPESQVIPALVGRLNDPDPVVRLAAHEQLKQRTGQDFGYLPWSEEAERQAAVARWQSWLGGDAPSGTAIAAPSPQMKAAPAPSPQHQPAVKIRRTIRR